MKCHLSYNTEGYIITNKILKTIRLIYEQTFNKSINAKWV